MSAQRRQPEVGQTVTIFSEAHDTELTGKVIDLLSSQFTIRIHKPSKFKGFTWFIFYSDEWT